MFMHDSAHSGNAQFSRNTPFLQKSSKYMDAKMHQWFKILWVKIHHLFWLCSRVFWSEMDDRSNVNCFFGNATDVREHWLFNCQTSRYNRMHFSLSLGNHWWDHSKKYWLTNASCRFVWEPTCWYKSQKFLNHW